MCIRDRNTRFYAGEEKGDPALASQMALLGDIYVNDAFGAAHRAHASTTVVANHFDAAHKAFGFLMQLELDNAKKVQIDPKHPYVAILGGAKVSDKILLIEALLDKADKIIIGGGMAYTFAVSYTHLLRPFPKCFWFISVHSFFCQY